VAVLSGGMSPGVARALARLAPWRSCAPKIGLRSRWSTTVAALRALPCAKMGDSNTAYESPEGAGGP